MSSKDHYADSSTDKIKQARGTIAAILVTDHKGKGNEIAGTKLAEAVGLKPTTVYDQIPRLRREYKIPVVSNGHGYFVVEDKDVYADKIEAIEEEIETKRQRKEELQAAFNNE
jgi:biotin operon repressor